MRKFLPKMWVPRYCRSVILSFSVANFRSFVEPASLMLTGSTLRTNIPRAGETWIQHTERVAAIYGPNAAGKSTFVEAIVALAQALRNPGDPIICQPSLVNRSPRPTTDFEVDFVAEGVRYSYTVRVAPWGIAHEELASYPKGTRRTLFVRRQENPDAEMEFERGSSLSGPTAAVRSITTPSMLFMATAYRYGHSVLRPVARALMGGVGIEYISFRDKQDSEVLHRVITEMVAAPDEQQDLVRALTEAADLGILRVEVEKQELSPEDQQRIIRVLRSMQDGENVELPAISRIMEVLRFVHRGADGEEFTLPFTAQSAGTLSWLTSAWHALDAVRRGSVLLIDELDASLHPSLARYIVELFTNPHLNPHGAQLIFTSHDVSLLGNSPTRLLDPSNVWLVSKDAAGRSEIYSQAEFENRTGNNSEKRYLAGKFGALPNIDDRAVLAYVGSLERELVDSGT